ncbi:hypothetical protein FOZ62_019938 [Perkinsus olseni]|uniref:Uncharacterized protein n=1 Tax=Perkinsus olseni TaxID=32597 RepID=A0A7J6NU76_PEROL|nr:hypothetical protein FOZ62_019938 [Perkinsus olseni]
MPGLIVAAQSCLEDLSHLEMRRITVLRRDSDPNRVLTICLGAVMRHEDPPIYEDVPVYDFPLLSLPSLWTKDNTPVCYYTAGTTFQENWESLEVRVGRDFVPRTMTVMCPKTDNHTAFMSKFSDEGRSDNLLVEYRPSRPHDKR